MSRYGWRVFWIVVALFALLVMTSLARRITISQQLQRDLDRASTEYAIVASTRDALQTQIARATQGLDVEPTIRAEGFSQPGDEVIVPVPVDTMTPQGPNTNPPTPTPTSHPPPWEIWWRLFFGPLE